MHLNNRIFANCILIVGMLVVLLSSACGSVKPVPVELTSPPVALPPPEVKTLRETPSASSMELPTATIMPDGLFSPTAPANVLPTDTPFPSLTPDPYWPYTIEYLAERSYGGGELVEQEILAVNSYFTRSLFTYPSDGLMIYGFMNVPKRFQGPFPVVIALHGYIDPQVYTTLDYTTGYADALARAGFLVLHPNLRDYPPSDEGDNLFRVGMAIDVLNLIAILKDQAGTAGPLRDANPQAIALWGHSMGGGVSIRVMTISPDVKAVVLYGSMSGDDLRNHQRIFDYFSDGTRGLEELSAPLEVFERISPVYYLQNVQAAVSIHHGEDDLDVPLAWSIELCQQLSDLEKPIECYTYPDQPHTFHGDGNELFVQRMIQFLDQELRDR